MYHPPPSVFLFVVTTWTKSETADILVPVQVSLLLVSFFRFALPLHHSTK